MKKILIISMILVIITLTGCSIKKKDSLNDCCVCKDCPSCDMCCPCK